jgi:hypothetical protein
MRSVVDRVPPLAARVWKPSSFVAITAYEQGKENRCS